MMRAHKSLATALAIGLLLGGASAYAYDAEFDYNGDGANDAGDLELIQAAFNTAEGVAGYDPAFDHDGDGVVSGTDIVIAQDAIAAEQ
jgi:hypothetical protein